MPQNIPDPPDHNAITDWLKALFQHVLDSIDGLGDFSGAQGKSNKPRTSFGDVSGLNSLQRSLASLANTLSNVGQKKAGENQPQEATASPQTAKPQARSNTTSGDPSGLNMLQRSMAKLLNLFGSQPTRQGESKGGRPQSTSAATAGGAQHKPAASQSTNSPLDGLPGLKSLQHGLNTIFKSLGSEGARKQQEGEKHGVPSEVLKRAKEDFAHLNEVLKISSSEARKAADAQKHAAKEYGDAMKQLRAAQQSGSTDPKLQQAADEAKGKAAQAHKDASWRKAREDENLNRAREARKQLYQAQGGADTPTAQKPPEASDAIGSVLASFLGKGSTGQKTSGKLDKLHDVVGGMGGKGGSFMGAAAESLGRGVTVAKAVEGDPQAIMKTVAMTMDNMKEIGGHIGNVGRQFGKAMEHERFEDVGQDFVGAQAEGTKAITKAIGGPVLAPLADWMVDNSPLKKFEEAILGTIGVLRKWGDQLHESNMRFSEFSGAMAGVSARQEVRDIQLSQERGNRRAASAENLEQGRHQLNQELAKFEDAWARIKGDVTGFLANELAGFFRASGLSKLMDKLHGWLDIQEGNAPDEEDKFFQELIDNYKPNDYTTLPPVRFR